MGRGVNWRVAVFLGTCFMIVALTAGCGSSSSSGGSSSASGGSAATSAAGATAGGASANVTAAKAAVQARSQAVTSIGVSDPLKKSIRGKTVVLLSCNTPSCIEQNKPFVQAGEMLGLKMHVIPVGTSPSDVTSSFDSMLAFNPDGVIDNATPVDEWKPQLAKLTAKNVPVVLFGTGESNGAPNIKGVFFASRDEQSVGDADAEWVIANSNGKGHALYVFPPAFAGLKPQLAAFNHELKAKCPSCSTDTLNVDVAGVGTKVPQQIVSYLESHPDTKYIVLQYGDLAIGVPSAIKGAGINGVHIISSAGGTQNYAYIRNGQQDADQSYFSNVASWQIVNALAQALAGQPSEVPLFPFRWITKSSANFTGTAPPFGDPTWQKQFEKLWAASES
jgi:ABC-type sugar transport system substrate-binding protein